MEKYIEDLAKSALFMGIEQHNIKKLLNCVNAGMLKYGKGELIIKEGDIVTNFGVMLSGYGRSFKTDTMGRVVTITLLKTGSEIGVMLVANPQHKSPVSVQAGEDSLVLTVPYDGLLTRCHHNCPHHEQMLKNYISIVAGKGLVLHDRIDCLLRPSVREKVMTYLTRVSVEQGSSTFSIPLDRYTMSEYLNVERSALSRELSRMKRDGIIDFFRNEFRLL